MSRLDRRNERLNNNQQPAFHVRIDPKPMKEIKTIMKGPSRFGNSRRSCERRVREARQLKELHQHEQLVEIVYQAKQHMEQSIEFMNANMQDV